MLKCSAKCKFYEPYINNDNKLVMFCRRRGIDIFSLPERTRDNCDKFVTIDYRRKNILNSLY